MMIPVFTQDLVLRRWPLVSMGIAFICLAAFISTDPARAWEDWGSPADRVDPLRLLTSMFMHADWEHLLFNFLAFFLTALFIEEAWGRVVFAALYMTGGIFASLFWMYFETSPNAISIGASGAISAVMGAFCLRYWKCRICFVSYSPIFWLRIPSWVVLPLWFYWEVEALEYISSVGHSAHVGGFVWGFATALVFRLTGFEKRVLAPRIDRHLFVVDNSVIETASRLEESGRVPAACQILQAAAARDPRNDSVALAFWQTAARAGRPESAEKAALSLVERDVRAGRTELAVRLWMDVHLTLPGAKAPASIRSFLAEYMVRRRMPQEGEALALEILRGESETTPLKNLLRVAEIGRFLDAPWTPEAEAAVARRQDTPPEVRDSLRPRRAGPSTGPSRRPSPLYTSV